MTTRRDRALSYYEALDDGDYEALSALLAEEFVHDRPDRTLAGRERFVRFMREQRPRSDTVHEVDGVYGPAAGRDTAEVVVRGRLLAAAGATAADGNEVTDATGGGELLVEFVDVFAFEGDSVARIDTYTR